MDASSVHGILSCRCPFRICRDVRLSYCYYYLPRSLYGIRIYHFIPEIDALLHLESGGSVEVLSPSEGAHVALLYALISAPVHRAKDHRPSESSSAVLLPGPRWFDHGRFRLPVHIHETVRANIVSLLRSGVNGQALKAVRIQAGPFSLLIGTHPASVIGAFPFRVKAQPERAPLVLLIRVFLPIQKAKTLRHFRKRFRILRKDAVPVLLPVCFFVSTAQKYIRGG